MRRLAQHLGGPAAAVWKGSSAVLAGGVALLVAVDCSGGTAPIEPAIPVAISVSPDFLVLAVGQKGQLDATVTGSSNTAVLWRTVHPSVASIGTSGEVTGVAFGTTVAVAIAQADSARRATASVTVTGGQQIIALLPASGTLTVGQTGRFVAQPNTWAWRWRSSDPAVATVDATGLASALAPGSTVITALAQADTTQRVSANLTVVPASTNAARPRPR